MTVWQYLDKTGLTVWEFDKLIDQQEKLKKAYDTISKAKEELDKLITK